MNEEYGIICTQRAPIYRRIPKCDDNFETLLAFLESNDHSETVTPNRAWLNYELIKTLEEKLYRLKNSPTQNSLGILELAVWQHGQASERTTLGKSFEIC